MANKKILSTVPGFSLYKKWHNSNYHFLIHWGIFLIAVALTWSLTYVGIGDWLLNDNYPGVDLKLPQPAQTQLILNPQTQTVLVGDLIESQIILDTGNESIDGVDVYALHYDPTLLKVIDDVPDQKGIQIKPGEILPLNAANIVDASSGTIKLGQVSSGGTSFKGKGVLATIHFKALAAGTAFLKFDFTPGKTIDSNAAYKGKDRLAKVVDAIYIIEPTR